MLLVEGAGRLLCTNQRGTKNRWDGAHEQRRAAWVIAQAGCPDCSHPWPCRAATAGPTLTGVHASHNAETCNQLRRNTPSRLSSSVCTAARRRGGVPGLPSGPLGAAVHNVVRASRARAPTAVSARPGARLALTPCIIGREAKSKSDTHRG